MKTSRLRVLTFFLSCAVLLSCLSGCAGTRRSGRDTDILYTESESPLPIGTEGETSPVTEKPETEIPAPMTEENPENITEMSTDAETEIVTETEGEPETEAPETEPDDGRIRLPKLTLMPLSEAEALLSENDLTYTLSYTYSEYAKDAVIHVSFRGVILDDCYRISPAYPVELTVSLGKRQHYNVGAVDDKTIYLTFDDGPSKLTEQFLAILAENDVRATFFMVGQYVSYYPEIAKKVYDAGHTIACRSYTHDYESLYASADTALAEVDMWSAAVEKATGKKPEHKVFRFPGGSTTRYMERDRLEDIYWALHDAGFTCFDWTLANNDRYLQGKPADQTTEDYLISSAKTTLSYAEVSPKMPKVMLMHDTSPETLAMLPWLIGYLKDKGYSFGTLDELDGDWLFYQ